MKLPEVYIAPITQDGYMVFLLPTIVIDLQPMEGTIDIAITWLFWQLGVQV